MEKLSEILGTSRLAEKKCQKLQSFGKAVLTLMKLEPLYCPKQS